jgi:hypothetical protein
MRNEVLWRRNGLFSNDFLNAWQETFDLRGDLLENMDDFFMYIMI